ncbi:hypothetical protein, partial [Vibrio parahaemolyticus]
DSKDIAFESISLQCFDIILNFFSSSSIRKIIDLKISSVSLLEGNELIWLMVSEQLLQTVVLPNLIQS